eukprot:1158314-Pelagomonas_calceolata.AAC.19
MRKPGQVLLCQVAVAEALHQCCGCDRHRLVFSCRAFCFARLQLRKHCISAATVTSTGWCSPAGHSALPGCVYSHSREWCAEIVEGCSAIDVCPEDPPTHARQAAGLKNVWGERACPQVKEVRLHGSRLQSMSFMHESGCGCEGVRGMCVHVHSCAAVVSRGSVWELCPILDLPSPPHWGPTLMLKFEPAFPWQLRHKALELS